MPIAIPGAKVIPGVFNGICQDYDNGKCTAIYHMCGDCPDRKVKMTETIYDTDLLRDILWDDAEGYRVISSIDEGGSRWHRLMSTVFVRQSDGKLFIAEWRKGATENQDHEFPDVAYEAEEYTETMTRYRVLPRQVEKSVAKLPKVAK